MPRTSGFRRDKAKELLRLASDGPSFNGRPSFNDEDFLSSDWDSPSAQYKRWSKSWLIPLIEELVPDLRKKRPKKAIPPRKP